MNELNSCDVQENAEMRLANRKDSVVESYHLRQRSCVFMFIMKQENITKLEKVYFILLPISCQAHQQNGQTIRVLN